MSKDYDIIVIGSGPGGYPAAIYAAGRGAKVLLIEKDLLGGTCLNRGCIPSKALIAAARRYADIAHASSFGIEVTNVKIDFPLMVERSEKVVTNIRKNLEALIRSNQIDILFGEAEFVSPTEIKVKGDSPCTVFGRKIILATGSEPRVLPAFPIDRETIHDSTSILQLKRLPKSLTVIGGGVIGVEFASLFHLLGVKVTIVEVLPRIISTESPEMSAALTHHFTKGGVKIHLNQSVTKIASRGMMNAIYLQDGTEISSEMVLIAVGRSVYTDSLNLKKATIQPDSRGAIPVNEWMETEKKGIYAIGDVTGKWWLAHVATHQGLVAASHALNESHLRFDTRAIPSVIFTDPEIASVGLSEVAAKEKGFAVRVGRFPFSALGKAQSIGETEGFAEVIIDSATEQILGAQVIGKEASILIAEMALAIHNELTASCVAETIHAHPTLSEVWMEACLLALGHPLHLPKKRSS